MSNERRQMESGSDPAWNLAWSYAVLRFTLGTTFLLHGIVRFVSGWPVWMEPPFFLFIASRGFGICN
jgi:hypothetical protein